MYCSRRLYKGNDYEICLPLTDTGVTLVRFYTGKDVYVEKEPEISGDSMCFSLMKEDLEPLTDGVIRYEVVTEYETTDTNSPYVLKTPENYDAKSLDEIIEEAYQSGYTDGYGQGYYDGEELCPCPDYSSKYLTIEALESGDLTIYTGSTEYSVNGGAWTQGAANTAIALNEGDKVRFRGTAGGSRLFIGNILEFNVYGNIESLEYGDDFKGQTSVKAVSSAFAHCFSKCAGLADASNLILPATTLAYECYSSMFSGCTSLTTAPELPATTLANNCYMDMFSNCTNLTTAPSLPATTLANGCYSSMFNGCTSLTQAPVLPATTLADYCYYGMFNGCTSLTSAPELPATTLAFSCYSDMFYNCTNLTTAPELPATTLAGYCYTHMFYDCTSLTTAPELPATTLADSCYRNMFSGCSNLATAPELPATTMARSCYQQMFHSCTSLNYIKCLATDISVSRYTNSWVYNVAPTGTFIKAASTTWPSGPSGIPDGWTLISQ